MADDPKRQNNVIRGNFRPPEPGVSSPFDLQLREEIEYRDDGPWLVVYAYGKRLGEVPIKPGTEPRTKKAKIIPLTSPS